MKKDSAAIEKRESVELRAGRLRRQLGMASADGRVKYLRATLSEMNDLKVLIEPHFPMAFAAEKGHLHCLVELLPYAKEVEIINASRTALAHGKYECFALLVRNISDQKNINELLSAVAFQGHLESFELVLQRSKGRLSINHALWAIADCSTPPDEILMQLLSQATNKGLETAYKIAVDAKRVATAVAVESEITKRSLSASVTRITPRSRRVSKPGRVI